MLAPNLLIWLHTKSTKELRSYTNKYLYDDCKSSINNNINDLQIVMYMFYQAYMVRLISWCLRSLLFYIVVVLFNVKLKYAILLIIILLYHYSLRILYTCYIICYFMYITFNCCDFCAHYCFILLLFYSIIQLLTVYNCIL